VKTIIQKNSVIPLYHQVKEYLKGQIASGVYTPDQMIPSERELAEEFEINRLTVRQAINELVNEGLLYRQRGVGTFVSSPKIEQPLAKLTNFTADMTVRGIIPGAQLVSMQVVPADARVASQLDIERGENVVELVRVRTGNGEPMALERSFMLYDKVRPLLTMNMENVSLYETLENVCGLRLIRAAQTMEIVPARTDEANLLDIGLHDAVMMIERRTYAEGTDKPIEYVRSLYRGDRYKFSIEMNI